MKLKKKHFYIFALPTVLLVAHFTALTIMLTKSKIILDPPAEYGSLFSDSTKNHINFTASFKYQNSDPFSIYEYKNKHYIFIYKIANNAKFNLLNIQQRNSHISCGFSLKYKYLLINEPILKIHRYAYLDSVRNNIILDWDDDSSQMVSLNDSVAHYSIKLNHFGIKYGEKDNYDFIFENKYPFSSVKLDVVIFKKNNSIYIAISSPIYERDLTCYPESINHVISI